MIEQIKRIYKVVINCSIFEENSRETTVIPFLNYLPTWSCK